MGFDFDDRLPLPVGSNRRGRRIRLELEGHLQIALLKEAVECVRVNVVTDEPLLVDYVLVVCRCNGRYDCRAERFVLGRFVVELLGLCHDCNWAVDGKPVRTTIYPGRIISSSE